MKLSSFSYNNVDLMRSVNVCPIITFSLYTEYIKETFLKYE